MATVREIHKALAQLIDQGMGDSELRLAIQPSYPLQELVEGLWFDEEALADFELHCDTPPTVYIVSGGQDHDSPYAPREAFENAVLEF